LEFVKSTTWESVISDSKVQSDLTTLKQHVEALHKSSTTSSSGGAAASSPASNATDSKDDLSNSARVKLGM
jgi:hypothetical protein